jgi:hypothetical protein
MNAAAAQALYPLKGMNNDSDIPPLLDWYKINIGMFQVSITATSGPIPALMRMYVPGPQQ